MVKLIFIEALLLSCLIINLGCRSEGKTTGQEDGRNQTSDLESSVEPNTTNPASISKTPPPPFDINVFLADQAKKLEFRKVNKPEAEPWESALNSTGEFFAFHFCNLECKIFVEDQAANQTYQIYSPTFLKHRNFADLVWSDEYSLEFRQATSPNISISYKIDVQNREVVEIKYE